MGRKLALLVALLVIPGALAAICGLLLARVLSRTDGGRRAIARLDRRWPRLTAGLRAIDSFAPRVGKALPLTGQAPS